MSAVRPSFGARAQQLREVIVWGGMGGPDNGDHAQHIRIDRWKTALKLPQNHPRQPRDHPKTAPWRFASRCTSHGISSLVQERQDQDPPRPPAKCAENLSSRLGWVPTCPRTAYPRPTTPVPPYPPGGGLRACSAGYMPLKGLASKLSRPRWISCAPASLSWISCESA